MAASLPHAALGALVTGDGRRRPLELASAVEVYDGNVSSMVKLLAVAARAQAADARLLLAYSRRLSGAGLIPVIDAAATMPISFLPGTARRRDTPVLPPPRRGISREILPWVDALEQRGVARAVETPWGVTATFALGSTIETQSKLDLRPDPGRPLFGPGVTVGLWTPVRGGPLDALAWNAREVGEGSRGDALGGWWAPPGGVLVHRAFFPAEICQPDVVSAALDSCIRRAELASSVVASRH